MSHTNVGFVERRSYPLNIILEGKKQFDETITMMSQRRNPWSVLQTLITRAKDNYQLKEWHAALDFIKQNLKSSLQKGRSNHRYFLHCVCHFIEFISNFSECFDQLMYISTTMWALKQ